MCLDRCFHRLLKRFRTSNEDILKLCQNGDIMKLKKINSEKIIPLLDKCLETAVSNFQKDIASYLLSINAKPNNALMKIACENNKPELVELLLKNGIEPHVVYRYTTSSIILGIAFKFENKD